MHRSTVRRATRMALGVVVAAAATGVAAGCGDDDKSSAKPKAFAITATAQGKNKELTFPKTVEAGLVSMTLKNTDKGPRSAVIVRIEGDHNTDNVLRLVEGDEPQEIPDFIQDGGGIAAVKPGETGTVTQNLAPGKYIVWDDQGGDGMGGGTKNWQLGAKGEFTVTGEASDDELPSVPATLTATDKGEKDYGFEFEGLKAGKNRVRFENTGEQLHHALLFPLVKGSTAADFETFVKSDGNSRPPVDFEKGSSTAVIDGDIAQNVELDLTAGNYVAVCFISDRDGEKKSHAEKGMIEGFVVK